MRIVFCCDPTSPRQVDTAFEREARAARELGIPFDLIDHDALVAGRAGEIVRRAESIDARTLCVYRGWMMTPNQYAQLFEALAARGRLLINDPEQFEHCHYLPSSYGVIEGHTPKTVWLESNGDVSMDDVMNLLRPMGDKPIIVKDYVKSQKHAWLEACFIPSASDRAQVERVVRTFLEMQGSDLNRGLVFREFVPFENVGTHPKSGMPLAREFRAFVLDGEPILDFRYWDEGTYGDTVPAFDALTDVLRAVRSRFFTADVARTQRGEWMIVELGDGQVSGLPEGVDPRELFQQLLGRVGLGSAASTSHECGVE